MSSIGFTDPSDYPPEARLPDAEDAHYAAIEADLRERGLPFPSYGVPEIAPERLEMEALWLGLPEAEKVRIGLIGLGLVVGGTIAAEAEESASAASRAGLAFCRAVEEEMGMMEVPDAVMAALRGPSWRIPAGLGPVCLACGCSEADACPGGCGWSDATQTRCTACADPDAHMPF